MALDSRTGRAEAWRTLAQRGVDTAAELSDVLAQKLGAAADPRAKLLRKRRWALRAALFFTFSTGSVGRRDGGARVVEHAGVGAADPGAIAVGAAFLATLSFLRYRWLQGARRCRRSARSRRLPPWGSAARQPMAALASAERGTVLAARRDGARPDAARRRACAR